jgi:endonuclease-3
VCVAAKTGDPFRVLVSTLLSLRNRDEATGPATERVMARWPTPEALAASDEVELGEAVRPSNLWRTKTRALRSVAQELVRNHGSRVPRTVEELVKIKWVGRKTANLVATLAYGEEGLCVDTHVHRISNRLGFVKTATPEETEVALKKLLPKDVWKDVNDWLVWFGRTTCKPTYPDCRNCVVRSRCPSSEC